MTANTAPSISGTLAPDSGAAYSIPPVSNGLLVLSPNPSNATFDNGSPALSSQLVSLPIPSTSHTSTALQRPLIHPASLAIEAPAMSSAYTSSTIDPSAERSVPIVLQQETTGPPPPLPRPLKNTTPDALTYILIFDVDELLGRRVLNVTKEPSTRKLICHSVKVSVAFEPDPDGLDPERPNQPSTVLTTIMDKPKRVDNVCLVQLIRTKNGLLKVSTLLAAYSPSLIYISWCAGLVGFDARCYDGRAR